jgi:hypothetical protein
MYLLGLNMMPRLAQIYAIITRFSRAKKRVTGIVEIRRSLTFTSTTYSLFMTTLVFNL